jgi:hypothetical protein
MPNMDGFELCREILKVDVNVKVCFITAGEINRLFDKENKSRVRVVIAIRMVWKVMECRINITIESLIIKRLSTVLTECFYYISIQLSLYYQ